MNFKRKMQRDRLDFRGEWIPVSERLPELWKDVLVILKDTDGSASEFCEVLHLEPNNVWRFWGDYCVRNTDELIAWMSILEYK